jgi:hypothetical protein
MGDRRPFFLLLLTAATAQWPGAQVAHGFVTQQRWQATASGPAGEMGEPITLTWSIVPDGTLIPGEGESNLVAFLDETFGAGTTGPDDLTLRPWFPLLSEPLNRWSEVSGLTFNYEPVDDGLTHGAADGVLGVRGDIRIGGATVDGPGGTLAYIYFPSNSDLAVDTADASAIRSCMSWAMVWALRTRSPTPTPSSWSRPSTSPSMAHSSTTSGASNRFMVTR